MARTCRLSPTMSPLSSRTPARRRPWRAACRGQDAGGLAGEQRLEMAEVEERRLHHLRLEDGTGHLQDRLVREHHRALRHRPDLAREAESHQPLEERVVEETQRAEMR